MSRIALEEIDDDFYSDDSIVDKIDKLEKKVLKQEKVMPEFLLLDRMSYEQLLYERGIKEKIDQYHGYTVAVINRDFDEIIRFI